MKDAVLTSWLCLSLMTYKGGGSEGGQSINANGLGGSFKGTEDVQD
jgi:hypothetical protein